MNSVAGTGFIGSFIEMRASNSDSAGGQARLLPAIVGAISLIAIALLVAAAPAGAQTAAPNAVAAGVLDGPSQSAAPIEPAAAAALASHPEAAALLNSDEFRRLKSTPEAELSDQEYRQLCAAISARHISAADVQSLGPALGLSSQQLSQIESCADATLQPSQTNAHVAEVAAGAPATSYVSSIETRFHDLDTPYKLLSQPSSGQLSQFGYELFSSKVSTFAPAENAPVSEDYVLGPGDTINVLLWGRINQTLSLQVQRDGTILMPEIGPIEALGAELRSGQEAHRASRRGDHRPAGRRHDGPGARDPGLRDWQGERVGSLHGQLAIACFKRAGRGRRRQ